MYRYHKGEHRASGSGPLAEGKPPPTSGELDRLNVIPSGAVECSTVPKRPPSAPTARPSPLRFRNGQPTLKPAPLRRSGSLLPAPWWYRWADRTPRWIAMPGPGPVRRPKCREFCGVGNQHKWDSLGPERSEVWKSLGELPEGPVMKSSPVDRLSLHLLSAL